MAFLSGFLFRDDARTDVNHGAVILACIGVRAKRTDYCGIDTVSGLALGDKQAMGLADALPRCALG